MTVPFRGRFNEYGILDGQKYEVSDDVDRANVELISGEMIGMSCPKDEDYCVFLVDTTSTKNPNISGRDLFELWLNKKTNQLYDGYADDEGNCTVNKNGQGCYTRIVNDNWEMRY